MEAGDNLVICGHDGMLNHYRIEAGRLRFRCITEDKAGRWRTLSDGDVLMHLMLKTRVAQWLYVRHGIKSGALLGVAA
ncbi:MAG TPA: hypothetical protein VJR04_10920 [Terriglobales bacterium]|nr:hypothetical protein [Terriglobales bacterium]